MIKIFGYLITIVAFVFLIKSIIEKHPDFSKITHPFAAVGLGLLITVMFVFIVYVSAYAWKSILEFIQGGKIHEPSLLSVYTKANIGKYLPGNFMHFAGRNVLAGKLGFTQLDIAFSTIIEIAVLFLTACFWSLLLAFQYFVKVARQSLDLIASHKVISAIAIIILVLAICGFLFLMFRKDSFRKYRRFLTRGFLFLVLKLFIIYSFTLLLPAASFVVILPAVFGCSMTPYVFMLTTAAYVTSWVAGYMVPGAPGGIGVRESVLLLVLGASFPSDILLIAIIFHRLLSVAGDGMAFLFDTLRNKVRKQQESKI